MEHKVLVILMSAPTCPLLLLVCLALWCAQVSTLEHTVRLYSNAARVSLAMLSCRLWTTWAKRRALDLWNVWLWRSVAANPPIPSHEDCASDYFLHHAGDAGIPARGGSSQQQALSLGLSKLPSEACKGDYKEVQVVPRCDEAMQKVLVQFVEGVAGGLLSVPCRYRHTVVLAHLVSSLGRAREEQGSAGNGGTGNPKVPTQLQKGSSAEHAGVVGMQMRHTQARVGAIRLMGTVLLCAALWEWKHNVAASRKIILPAADMLRCHAGYHGVAPQRVCQALELLLPLNSLLLCSALFVYLIASWLT